MLDFEYLIAKIRPKSLLEKWIPRMHGQFKIGENPLVVRRTSSGKIQKAAI